MAGAMIRMSSNKQKSLQEIHEKIHYIVDVEQISKLAQIINDVTIWTLAYEKFYMRTSSYASATIVLTEHEQTQTACIVATGGGEGIFNLSYGTNRDLAKSVVKALEECGFTMIEPDIDTQGKNFLERLLK